MARRRVLVPHPTVDESEGRYRGSRDAVARSQWQIIWLLAQGKTTATVIEATGYSEGWISVLVGRYNAGGDAGIGDRRHTDPGAAPLLDAAAQEALRLALAEPPTEGGQWTGPKVARWMAGQLGHPVHPQRGWEQLRRVGYTPQVPRPAHPDADLAAQAAFKQTGLSAVFLFEMELPRFGRQ